ncbi:MAG: hypothetical protein IPK53_04840 [bacterium]|nr:hypothetical protein [bacterium]MBK8128285.1 hypothetical protein [bacterium]
MQINLCRVIRGGLVAGLLIIISAVTMVPVVGDDMNMALARFNLPPLSLGAMVYFAFVSISMGILLVWLYAALIPRFGKGPKTALIAAFILWFMGNLLPNVANVFYGFMPVKLTIIGIIWGLGELFVGSLVGTRIYREREGEVQP